MLVRTVFRAARAAGGRAFARRAVAVGFLGLCLLVAGVRASSSSLPLTFSAADPWVQFWGAVAHLAAAAGGTDSVTAPPQREERPDEPETQHEAAWRDPGSAEAVQWRHGDPEVWAGAEAESTTVALAPPAHPPAPVADAYVVVAPQSLEVAAPGLLENDVDADGDALDVMLEEAPERGSLDLGSDGSFVYTPEPGFIGSDRFTYAVSDGSALSIATVTITTELPPAVTFTFQPCDDATIVASRANVAHGAAEDLQVRSGGAEQRSLLKFAVQGLGMAVPRVLLRLYCLDGGADGGRIQRVASEYARSSEPWMQAGLSWNNAPVPDGLPLAFLGSVTAGSWVEIDLTGVVQRDGIYSFALLHGGRDLVAYGARESRNPPQLLITTHIGSEAGNTHPVVAGDTYAVEAGSGFECMAPGLLENDSDGDGDVLFLIPNRAPAHGALLVYPDGSFTYTPDPGYFGPDTFTYFAADGRGGLGTGVVVLEVAPLDLVWGAEPPAQKAGPPPQTASTALAALDPTRIVPNPCRGSTWIEYGLPQGGWVEAAIYDARGHLVRLLAAGPRPAGRQQVHWNGTNEQGALSPSGIYFLRLRLGETLQKHKIVLQR